MYVRRNERKWFSGSKNNKQEEFYALRIKKYGRKIKEEIYSWKIKKDNEKKTLL